MDSILSVYYFSLSSFYYILVIDLLSYSLEDLFYKRKQKFTLKTVAMLAKRIVYISSQPQDA